jgi:hypothetical protein
MKLLTLFNGDHFIDPQLLPHDYLEQKHRLHVLVKQRVKDGMQIDVLIPNLQRLLGEQDWYVELPELFRFANAYYLEAADPEIAKKLNNDRYLTHYFELRSAEMANYQMIYGEQIMASEIATPYHLPAAFLQHLYPVPPIIRITMWPHEPRGVFWTGGEIPGNWGTVIGFVPLPVNGQAYPVKNQNYVKYVKSEAVTAWPYAAAYLPRQPLQSLTNLILEPNNPIVSVVASGSHRSHVIVKVEATDHKDWLKKVRGVKEQFNDLGLQLHGFKSDSVTYAPRIHHHLIYLRNPI